MGGLFHVEHHRAGKMRSNSYCRRLYWVIYISLIVKVVADMSGFGAVGTNKRIRLWLPRCLCIVLCSYKKITFIWYAGATRKRRERHEVSVEAESTHPWSRNFLRDLKSTRENATSWDFLAC